MAAGDPPVTGNPIDPLSGTFSIDAKPSSDPDNTLVVRVRDDKGLEIFINPGGPGEPITLKIDKRTWFMEIREVDLV